MRLRENLRLFLPGGWKVTPKEVEIIKAHADERLRFDALCSAAERERRLLDLEKDLLKGVRR